MSKEPSATPYAWISARPLQQIRAAITVLALGAGGLARAQEPPAPPPPPPAPVESAAPQPDAGEPRFRELLERQRRLEEQVRSQQQILDTLKKTAALPPLATDTPASQHLAVPRGAVRGDDPELTAPLAGYSDKNFFLRDRHSWFVIVPKGRVHIDWYNFLNRGDAPAGVVGNSAADPRPRDTIFIKRARLGLAGTIARGIDFRVENDFASQPTPGQYGTLTDADVVVNYSPYIRFEAGQFYVPFTLENATSENYTDFMEKASPVRYVAPLSRDLGGMLLGDLPRAAGRWYLGVFNGDGPNIKNLDNSPAIISRAFFAPVSLVPHHPAWTELIWLGGSIWWQQTTNLGGAAAPSLSGAAQGDLSPFTTQGGFTLFNSNYGDGSDLKTKQSIRDHLAPDGTTLKYAFEVNVPLWKRLGLRAEYMHQSIDVREYLDVNDGAGNLKRTAGSAGNLAGWGAYVEGYVWIGGPLSVDLPGLYQVPHWSGYVPPPAPRWALMLAVKYEHVEQDLTGLKAKDPWLGKLALDTFSLGANFWVTRHTRFIADYVMNYVGNIDAPTAAVAFSKNYFFKKIDNELLFRLDVHL
jgi:hypothetical protein